MAAAFACPKCGQRYGFQPAIAARQVKCKKCGTAFRVPGPREPSDAASAPPTSSATAGSQPSVAPTGAGAAPPSSLDDLLSESFGPLEAGGGLPPLSPGDAGMILAPRSSRTARARRKMLIAGLAAGGGLLVLVLLVLLLIPKGGGTTGSGAPSAAVGATDEIPSGVLSPVDVKVDSPGPAAGGKTQDQLVDEMIAQMTELSSLLSSVRDQSSLQAVKSRLPKLVARINETIKQGMELERAGQPISANKKRAVEQKRAEIQATVAQAGPIIAKVPGAVELLPEIQKIGRVSSTPTQADIQALIRMSPEEHLKRLVGKHGPQKTVALVVEGIPPDRLGPLGDKVFSACPGIEQWPSASGDRRVIYIAPVTDLNAFAAKLDLGETKVNSRKRIVVVKADPAKLPAPLQAEVTDPNDPNFYTQNLSDLNASNLARRWNAVKRLKAAEPKQLRGEIAAALKERMVDENMFVGQDAVDAYALWATGDIVPDLIDVLSKEDKILLHARVVEQLTKLKDARAVKPMAARIRFDFKAAESLKQFGPAAEPDLIPLLDDPDPLIRGKACSILGAVGTAKSLEKVKSLASDANSVVQISAKRAAESISRRAGETK